MSDVYINITDHKRGLREAALDERALIVAWLRSFGEVYENELADVIESGVHLDGLREDEGDDE